MLSGKTVVLGVTGSIAAYKICTLASSLVKLHADVHVIMTKNACNFVNPITFETLTSNKCIVDTFDRNFQYNVEHVSLAQKADIFMIAPASANVIGKIANGIADDMLTTTVMACKKPVYLSPAMNTGMFENPIVQDNLQKLKKFGYHIIEPAAGRLACGDTGKGKLPEPEDLLQYILAEIACEKDLQGLRVLITAGPTQESLDPVRYITNHSTGKMGYAIARRAMLRGADVTLITGPSALQPPPFVKVVPVVTAEDMYREVTTRFAEQDIVIKSAAVADYTPIEVADNKIKKTDDDFSIACKRTKDILATIGEQKRPDQFLCGFSMETQNTIPNARKKLCKKNLDLVVANNVKTQGAGFGTDTNVVTLISKESEIELPILSKEEVGNRILNAALRHLTKKQQPNISC